MDKDYLKNMIHLSEYSKILLEHLSSFNIFEYKITSEEYD